VATPKKTTQITLDMNLNDSTFLKIAKVAHTNNCTFNEAVNRILADAIARLNEPAKTKTEEPANG